MPDVVIFFLAVFSVALFLASFYSWNDIGPNPLFIIPLFLAVGLWFWFGSVINAPVPVESVKVFVSKTVDDIDCIVNDYSIVNLNLVFHRHIKSGTKIKVTKYKNGYWVGKAYVLPGQI